MTPTVLVREGLVLACVLAVALAAPAQTPDLRPDELELEPPDSPTVTFSYSFPSSDPSFFAVAVNAMGRAAYESRGVVGISGEPREPYSLKFTFSEKNRDRVFALVQELDYFQGDFDFKRRRIAATGLKTLRYRDANRRVDTTYNWSQNPGIQELTALFHRVGNTLEYGRRLRHLRRYDRLGIDAELKNLEQLVVDRKVAEMHVIAPLLREIASDPVLMRVVRERAQRILKRAGEPLQPDSREAGALVGSGGPARAR